VGWGETYLADAVKVLAVGAGELDAEGVDVEDADAVGELGLHEGDARGEQAVGDLVVVTDADAGEVDVEGGIDGARVLFQHVGDGVVGLHKLEGLVGGVQHALFEVAGRESRELVEELGPPLDVGVVHEGLASGEALLREENSREAMALLGVHVVLEPLDADAEADREGALALDDGDGADGDLA